MEVPKYIEFKSLDLIKISKINNSYAITTSKFDAITGKLLSPEIEAIDLDLLKSRQLALQKELESLNLLIEDLQFLP